MELEKVIKSELGKLPDGCQYARNGNTFYNGYHEWVRAYDAYELINGKPVAHTRNLNKTIMLPNFICKYCYAVGELDSNIPYDEIIRRIR